MAIREFYNEFEDFGGLGYQEPLDASQPETSYYTYGAIPSSDPVEEPVYVPRMEDVGLTPMPPAAPGPIQEFVGTPFMPEFPVTPVAPPSPLTAAVEDRVAVPRGEDVPVTPLASLPEAPSLTPRGEDVPVSALIPTEAAPLAAELPAFGPLQSTAPPDTFDPNAPINLTPEQVKSVGNAMAMAGLVDPNAFGNMYVGDAAFGGGPPLDVGRYARNVAKDSVGGQGSLYEEGALEAAKAAAKDPYTGLFGQNLRDVVAQDPSLQPMVDAKINRDLERIAKVEQDYGVMKPLSDLLKANRFQEAFAYAKDNGLTDRLLKADWLSQLRQPFTPEEMQQFYNAIPPDYAGSKFNYDPQGAAKRAITSMGATPQWSGYPDPQAVFVRKDDETVENLAKIAGVAMLTAGLAPGLLGGASGAAGGAGAGAGATGAGALTGVVPAGVLPGSAAATLGATATYPIVAGAGGLGAGTLAGAAGAGALASQLGGGAAAPTTTTAPVTPADALQEVLVTGSKVPAGGLNAIVPTTLASTNLIRGVSDIPVDIYGQPVEPPPTEAPPEGAQAPLAEILVTAPKPLSALDVAAGATVPAFSKAIADMGYRAPAFETTPIEDIPEVVVRGTAPKPIDLTSVVGPLTAAQLMQGFTQPQVDPLTGELKEPPKTQQELDAIQDALATGKPIPGALTATDVLKSAISKYQDLQKLSKLLQLLGGLGAAATKSKTGTTGTGGLGGGDLGGALPKYEFQRTQLSPDIDYYRYGQGPEAKFFEDTVVTPKDAEDTMVVGPKDKPPIFKSGGLTGYAKGGDSSPQYVAGPGSGRDDKIPALLSDGEYVIDAETLALLGDGSTKEGARRMDDFRAKIRKHKGRALSRGRISPDAKSPEKYMGGGLT